jgi:hypothetical protein
VVVLGVVCPDLVGMIPITCDGGVVVVGGSPVFLFHRVGGWWIVWCSDGDSDGMDCGGVGDRAGDVMPVEGRVCVKGCCVGKHDGVDRWWCCVTDLGGEPERVIGPECSVGGGDCPGVGGVVLEVGYWAGFGAVVLVGSCLCSDVGCGGDGPGDGVAVWVLDGDGKFCDLW